MRNHAIATVTTATFTTDRLSRDYFTRFKRSPVDFDVFYVQVNHTIAARALSRNKPASIALPSDVARVNPCTFCRYAGLASVALPSTVSTLPTNMFNSYDHLADIRLPRRLRTLNCLPHPASRIVPSINAFTKYRTLGRLALPPRLGVLNTRDFGDSNLADLATQSTKYRG